MNISDNKLHVIHIPYVMQTRTQYFKENIENFTYKRLPSTIAFTHLLALFVQARVVKIPKPSEIF